MKNKVAILSYSTTKNYGGLLQMFALQKIIKNLGFCVEHIRYKEPKTIQTNVVKKMISKIYSFFFKKIFFDRKRYKNETLFRQELVFSESVFYSLEDLKKYETDYFIVGSDQVWNPYINGFDASYALAFKSKAKKIAFSASLGIDKNIPQEWLKTLTCSFNDYDYLSVREETAKKTLDPLTKKEIHVDLDPTLLLDEKDYKALEKKSSIKMNKKFLLCYLMPGDRKITKRIIRDAKQIGKEKKLKVVTIGLRDIERINIFDSTKLFGCGPYEFIYLVSNAEIVLTNSFHGTALSILFKKIFYSYVDSNLNSSTYLGTRITDLIDSLELSDNLIDIDKMLYAPQFKNVDYEKPNLFLEEKKSQSLKRLIDELKL